MQDLGQEFYALGNTKILMMPETKDVLNKCKIKASESRNRAANVLKKAFPLFTGAVAADRKREAVRATQVRYKLKYSKRQRAYALHFRHNFERAITEFKAEKRKVYE